MATAILFQSLHWPFEIRYDWSGPCRFQKVIKYWELPRKRRQRTEAI